MSGLLNEDSYEQRRNILTQHGRIHVKFDGVSYGLTFLTTKKQKVTVFSKLPVLQGMAFINMVVFIASEAGFATSKSFRSKF